jgi:hypothetical protein
MPRIARVGCLLLIGLSIGCGQGTPSTSNAGTPPPHAGQLIPLPKGGGFVEVVKKAGGVTFYFFKDSSYAPFSPAPSVGTLAVGQGKKLDLKPEGDGLTTPPGTPVSKSGDVDGILNVELGGKAYSIPLGFR